MHTSTLTHMVATHNPLIADMCKIPRHKGIDHSEYLMGLPSSQQLHGCVTNRHVIITLLNGSSLLREKATHVEPQDDCRDNLVR